MVSWIKPQVRDFEYHLPIEFTTEETPKTWTEKINLSSYEWALYNVLKHELNTLQAKNEEPKVQKMVK